MTEKRRRVLWWVRLAAGMVLLAWVISRADLAQLGRTLADVQPWWLLAMVLVPHLGIYVSAIKWRILLREVGIRAPLTNLFVLYLIGTFFNNFLPSMVGGDAVRAYQLHKEKRDASGVIAATFMERYVGLAGLFTLLPLAFFRSDLVAGAPWLPGVTGVAFAGYVGATIYLFSGRTLALPEPGAWIGPVSRLYSVFRKARGRLLTFRGAPGALLASYLISVAFYFLAAVTVSLACRAVGSPVDLLFLAVAVPVVLLAGLLPVSVNGLGITEGGYVLFLKIAGLSTVEALSVALLIRGRILVTAVIGAVCFLLYRSDRTDPGMTDAVSE